MRSLARPTICLCMVSSFTLESMPYMVTRGNLRKNAPLTQHSASDIPETHRQEGPRDGQDRDAAETKQTCEATPCSQQQRQIRPKQRTGDRREREKRRQEEREREGDRWKRQDNSTLNKEQETGEKERKGDRKRAREGGRQIDGRDKIILP